MVDLRGKKILLFSPYGCTKHYGEAIKEELETRGAFVDGYDERPSQNPITKIIIRLFKKRIPQLFDKYIKSIIRHNIDKDYDFILICRGEAFTPLTIKSLRKAYPNAKVLLYLWDVMHDCAMDDVLSSCDKVMSFDPEDAKKHRIGFRPTFYVNDYLKVKETTEYKYDIEFICTLYHPRQYAIKKLKQTLESQQIRLFLYLYVPGFIMYVHEYLFHFPFYPFRKIHINPLSISETLKVLGKTRCILDINPPYQVSLSTRAHEAIASKRK